jgi:uncharacterized membrane protein YjfL (UPF0719 family)
VPSISHPCGLAGVGAGLSVYNGAVVEWRVIGLNFLYAGLGVLLMFLSYRAIDLLTPEVDFPDELRKGNVAVAIVIASIFIAIAIIVGGALN